MSARTTTTRTRPKKLQSRQHIQIVREDQVDTLVDFDSGRGPIETGVEKGEEAEYHLQQAIKASQVVKEDARLKDAYIPTPPTIASDVQYDVLYPTRWKQPATYIRSSATVEDCAGTPYCLDEEDEVALKLINSKLPNGTNPISEDHFEDVMNFFEEVAQTKQPFAAVDNAAVLPLTEFQENFDDTHPAHVRTYSILVYDHWCARRNLNGNRLLPPHLKFETGQENDDSDPYVCFRRRELRQIRKTRNRDAQSAEKLRKLRFELETARQVLTMIRRREHMRKEVLEIDREVFVQRDSFRQTKRKLDIKGDEELLINQKKQKLPQGMSPNQAALAQGLRMPLAPGASGSDLRTLEEVQAERTRSINNEIQINIEKHLRWNEGFVDKTRAPLSPEVEGGFASQPGQFREAMPATEYLPTPPASIPEEEAQEIAAGALQLKDDSGSLTPFRYASPTEDDPSPHMPSFRRRVGRGGRVLFDRRFPYRHRRDPDPGDDRWKYDSDAEEAENVKQIDNELTFAQMAQRAYLFTNSRQADAQQALARKTSVSTSNQPTTSSVPAQVTAAV